MQPDSMNYLPTLLVKCCLLCVCVFEYERDHIHLPLIVCASCFKELLYDLLYLMGMLEYGQLVPSEAHPRHYIE